MEQPLEKGFDQGQGPVHHSEVAISSKHAFIKRSGSPQTSWRRTYALLTVPAILAVAALIVLPLTYAFYLSLRDFSLIRENDQFVGIAQYAKLVDDPLFFRALANTFLYVCVVVGSDFLLGFGAAILLYVISDKWSRVFRLAFMLPMMIMDVVAAVLWRNLMFNPPFAEFGRIFHIEGSILSRPETAIWGIILAAVWGSWPFVFVLLYAGLESLPREPLEAAAVDGANWQQTVRYVILPMMKPVIVITLGIKAVDSFKSFEFAWILTRGGPAEASHVLGTFAYQRAFLSLDYGYGSAASIALAALAFILFLGFYIYLWRQGDASDRD